MRGWKALFSAVMLWASSSAFSFDFNSSYYGVYETGPLIYGCGFVYIVPKSSFLIIGVDQPTPIMFMPQTTGFRLTWCSDGSLSGFTKVNLTASDMAAQGATLSSYKLFGGDFDGDGKPDFFLQGTDTVRNSVVLTADATGTPKIFINYYGSLGSAQYPQVNIVDVDRDGRSDIVTTDTFGNVSTYFSSDYAGGGSGGGSGANTLVGSINGKFRVDESGNSTYSIDILSAAGTAGVAPHISLNYSSGAGDGVAGTGWSIGGLSAITRCRQTLGQDGNATAITLGASDRFCLDGQRLILTGGTYGADGSTYRTEIDSYAVVTILNSSTTPGNPMGFSVVRKDGSTSLYGAYFYNIGADSQQVVGGKVLNWSISRFQDSVGNAIRYQYSNNTTTNENLISRIDYAYGSDSGQTTNTNTYLQFNYQNRLDASSGYVAGSKIQRTQRLASIYSYNNGTEIRHYSLTYRTTDSTHYQSYVQQLSECVGSSCLSPTTFNWDLNNGGFQSGVQVSTVAGAKPLAVRVMDINGDGKADLVYMQQTAPYNLYYQLGSGSGYSGAVQFANVADGNANWLVLDFNNDGYQDLLVGTTNQNWKLYAGGTNGLALSLDTGIPFLAGGGNTVAQDLNGDGLPDIAGASIANKFAYRLLTRSITNGQWVYSLSSEQAPVVTGAAGPCNGGMGLPAATRTLDYDGDGRVDLTAYDSSYSHVDGLGDFYCTASTILLSTGNNSYTTTGWTSPIITVGGSYKNDFTGDFFDLNNDGLADRRRVDANSNYVFELNVGGSFGSAATLGANSNMSNLSIADYNADGYPDLIYRSGSSLAVRFFNPNTQNFDAQFISPLPFQAGSGSLVDDQDIFVDADGDGHTDLLRVQNTASNNVITLYKSADAGKVGNKITSIDNGLGNTTSITYKPLTDNSIYTKTHDANDATKWPGAPVFDIVAPSYVVASVSSTAPAANASTPNAVNYNATSSVSYQYAGLKMQASGRGSLGFASITTTDNQSLVKTKTTYNQNFPFIGQPLTTTLTSNAGIVFKTSTNTQASVTQMGTDGTKYYQIYTPTVTEQTNDPVGGWELSYVVTGTGQPDAWGNVMGAGPYPGIVVTTFASDHTTAVKQLMTYNSYGSSVYEQQFSRLSGSLVIQRRPNLTDVQRTSNFTYYGSGDGKLQGLLKTESVSTPDGSATATTTYQYDAFGNKNKITRSASGLADRYELIDYDAAGRFPTTKKSAFYTGSGWVDQITEQVMSRNAYGLPLQVNSLNGLVTTYQYDILGRERYRSDNTGAGVTTTYFSGGSVAGSKYYVTTKTSTNATVVQYFDVLGRGVAKQQTAFDGRMISTETEYDNVGRVKRQSLPHYSTDTAQYWATNNYDAFRLLNQQVPSTGGVIAQTSNSYSGLTTVSTNALNQTRTEVRNAAGELVSVTDYLGGVISYTYDAAGQLIQTATMGGASTEIDTYLDYDQLGRKIKMRDSDKGTWFYAYNAFGDLTDQYKVMSTSKYTGTLSQALADNSVLMQHTHMDYDKRGRLIARKDYRETRPMDSILEGTATWTYDTAANGVGQLVTESGGGLTRTYSYDALGRPSSTMHNDGNGTYLLTATYDAFGRPRSSTDALGTGSGTYNSYNSFGYLQSVVDIATNNTLYSVQNMDARGNVTSAILGNGATSSWTYDQGSGLVTNQTATVGVVTLQRLDYTWDVLGNQTSRQDRGVNAVNNVPLQQGFCYDGLNRLTKTIDGVLSGSCSAQNQQYDSFGNITTKTNVGTYSYSSAHPHQLASTGDGVAYTYDNVGNLTSDTSGRVLHYTVFDKADLITKGSNQIGFVYGSDRNYYKRVDTVAGVTSTTYYIGNIEKVVKSDGSYDMKRYLAGVALWNHHYSSAGAAGAVDKQFMYKDALGSVVLITDGVGVVKQQFAFNSWGERVHTTNWQTVLASTTFLPVSQQFTTHSFTGQDALDAVGLINYGGRIYDPRLGRFIQADPFVQDGMDLQAYNRYAYVRNNPLTLTDPSGFLSTGIGFVDDVIDEGGRALSRVNNVYKSMNGAANSLGAQAADFTMRWTAGGQLTYHALAALPYDVGQAVVTIGSAYCMSAYAACVAAGTYVNARAHGVGSDDAFRAGAVAGASAMAFNAVGNQFTQTPLQSFSTGTVGGFVEGTESIIAHGMVGGVMSVLSGGKFGDGFVGAGLSTGLSLTSLAPGGGSGMMAARIAIAAVAGGTVSELTGGKFANGAMSAAFSQAFNDEAWNHSLAGQCSSGAGGAAACTAAVNAQGGDAMKGALIDFGNLTIWPTKTFTPLGQAVDGLYGLAKTVYGAVSRDSASFWGNLSGWAYGEAMGRVVPGSTAIGALGSIGGDIVGDAVESEIRK